MITIIYKEKLGIEFLFICPECNQGEFRFLSADAIKNLKEMNCHHCLKYSKVPDETLLELKLTLKDW